MPYYKKEGTDIHNLSVVPTLKNTFAKEIPKASQQFFINRPTFNHGTHFQPVAVADNIDNINQRRGVGNFNINRPNFLQSPILPRMVNFDGLAAVDIQNNGIKVQLSGKTLSELLDIKIPDPTDVLWINEKNRLIGVYRAQGMSKEQIDRELEINKPLAREQRTLSKNQKLGEANLSIEEKIRELTQEVKDGRVQSQADKAWMVGQFATLLQKSEDIERMSIAEFQNIDRAMIQMNVPRDYRRMGLVRFYDITNYRANEGLINLYLILIPPNQPDLTYDRPIRNLANPNVNTSKISSMIPALARPLGQKMYLDLEYRGVLNETMIKHVASKIPTGFADTTVFAIDPANIPP